MSGVGIDKTASPVMGIQYVKYEHQQPPSWCFLESLNLTTTYSYDIYLTAKQTMLQS